MPGIDSFTKLMLHMNSDFSDSSDSGHTPTVLGVTIDTGVKKFGAGAGKFVAASSQYVTYPDHADWNLRPTTNDDLTIDFWVRFDSVASSQGIMGQYVNGSNFWGIAWNQSINKLYIYEYHNPTQGIIVECAWAPSAGTWYHIAFVVSLASGRFIFIDGVSQTLTNDTNALITDFSAPLKIGIYEDQLWYLDGWLEELRISKGTARWTSNFTPPTTEYIGISKMILNQRYALTAPALIKAVLNQRYTLDAYILNQSILNQRYALNAPTLYKESLSQRYALSGVVLNLTSLDQLWALVVPTGPHVLSLNQRYILNGFHIPATVYHAVTYTLTLTGAPDGLSDIVLPMSSFQSRLKDGDPSWLSVVVPNGRQYADDVDARPNGEIVIDRNGIKADGSLESIEIARVILEDIRTDEGGRSSALTLSGYKTISSGAPKGIALDSVRVRSEYKGKRRAETKMDSAPVPGDQAEMDGQIFTIGEITRYVNTGRTQMTVIEK